MKLRSIVYIIFLLISSAQAQRQSVLKTNQDVLGYNLVPQEKVFIHYNSSLLFAGEYLYYQMYCFNAKNNRLSAVSKVGYLVLIDEKGKSIFKHKIKLENGLGQGDFFVPVSIPSGNYKLLGYTQWMLNADSNFFQADISILNPYQGNQSNVLSEDVSNDSLVNPIANVVNDKFPLGGEENSNVLSLNSDKKNYKKRSLVKLSIESSDLVTALGEYSISIRKKDYFSKIQPPKANDFLTLYKSNPRLRNISAGESVFLPEMRGELIYGKILSNNGSSFPIAQQSVGFSLPGEMSDLKIVSTDEKGRFVFNVNNRNTKNEVLIQVLGAGKNNYTIQLDEIPEIENPNLEFYQFKISPTQEDSIIKRSVQNQIDNNFYSVKPDTIQESNLAVSFYGKNLESYELDEYTRFGTVKETILEVVEGVRTKKDDDGNEIFDIKGYYPSESSYGFVPLLIVDGVFVQEHDNVINYDARKVKNISIIRDRYYLGTQIFEGVLIVETISKEYVDAASKGYRSPIALSRLQEGKRYFRQQYGDNNSETYNRIPDYRNQLFWQPNVSITEDKTTLEFYTSDVTGDFEISFEGFTKKGKPVSIKQSFTVQ